ncbi:hypothetical protein ATANTOWER_014627 [Ataeniobius toweri]|uniref:Secreted protein n=1 Tax=Ataeniobius toweri TaxID=208326 RepID=A0ABU7CJ06_9TELE|nr:hypothetical protein [Ataeniobius toweri]
MQHLPSIYLSLWFLIVYVTEVEGNNAGISRFFRSKNVKSMECISIQPSVVESEPCRTSSGCRSSRDVSTSFEHLQTLFLCKTAEAPSDWMQNICKHQFSSLATDSQLDSGLDFD